MPVEISARPVDALLRLVDRFEHARKDLDALVGDAERVQPGMRRLAAHLHHLHLAHHRVAARRSGTAR